MLTWYASMNDWEKSRALAPADNAKWARRSEMELSHWADAGRLALEHVRIMWIHLMGPGSAFV